MCGILQYVMQLGVGEKFLLFAFVFTFPKSCTGAAEKVLAALALAAAAKGIRRVERIILEILLL